MSDTKTYVSLVFTFDAAHRLHLLPETHKCRNLHGHTYTVEVTLQGKKLDEEYGWVEDFGKIKELVGGVINQYDHAVLVAHLDNKLRVLAEELGSRVKVILDRQTTSEAIAAQLFWEIEQVISFVNLRPVKVTVSETPKSKAIYEEMAGR